MEEILQKLEILKKQMQENARINDVKPDSKENQNSEKISGFVFNQNGKDSIFKGTTFEKLK